jgi:hypothetical protein
MAFDRFNGWDGLRATTSLPILCDEYRILYLAPRYPPSLPLVKGNFPTLRMINQVFDEFDVQV